MSPVITGTPTKCEVCGTPVALAWWWADPDPASTRKVRVWLEWPWIGTLSDATHTSERCAAVTGGWTP